MMGQKPIRILQVFARMNRGGAESMIMNIYRNIDRSKVQFDFVVHTQEECAFDAEIKLLGGKIFRIPNYKFTNHISYKESWYQLFNKHPEYKIIHGHVRSTASIYLKIAQKYKLVTIAHSHSTSNGKDLQSILKKMLQIPIKIHSNYLFAASCKAGAWLFGEKAIESEKFSVLNNSIETNKYVFNESIRKKKRLELGIKDEIIIGHVGNFKKEKNHLFLIDIFNEFHKENTNSILLLIGDGVLENEILDKITDYNLNDKVLLLGSRSDVGELLQTMDVFVFPSVFEGLPVTVIEAQAAGLPCLISDNITNEVSLTNLVQYISIKKPPLVWSDSIKKTVANYKRENMEQEIINANYDSQTIANKIQSFYLNCI